MAENVNWVRLGDLFNNIISLLREILERTFDFSLLLQLLIRATAWYLNYLLVVPVVRGSKPSSCTPTLLDVHAQGHVAGGSISDEVTAKESPRGQWLPIRGQLWLKKQDGRYYCNKGKSAKTWRLGSEGRGIESQFRQIFFSLNLC